MEIKKHRLFAFGPVIFLLISPILGQSGTVAPYNTHTCNAAFYNGDLQCGSDTTQCCAGGASCCAGGCCPIGATCIYQGTSNEACCPANDPTACGAAKPRASATGPVAPGPSVSCVGVNDNWYCPHGYTCLYATGGCLPPPGSGSYSSSTDDSASATSFSEADPSSTVENTQTSSTQNVDSGTSATAVSGSTDTSAGSGPQSSSSQQVTSGTPASSGVVGGSSSTTSTSGGSGAAKTTAASAGRSYGINMSSGLLVVVISWFSLCIIVL